MQHHGTLKKGFQTCPLRAHLTRKLGKEKGYYILSWHDILSISFVQLKIIMHEYYHVLNHLAFTEFKMTTLLLVAEGSF